MGDRGSGVLPDNKLSPRCAVNAMAQYYPAYRAATYPSLDRCPTRGARRSQGTGPPGGLCLND
ncbi:MAG TPA: hypothetical protein PLE68_10565 [Bacillota bacterium]|nr:hypothetical protein [Bacillota bacterium]